MNPSNGNPMVASMVQGLETAMSPEAAAVIAAGPPPDAFASPPPDPMSAPITGFAPFAPPAPPAFSRGDARAVEKAADQRQATLTSQSLRKFGQIAKLFPGAERVRVRKRLDDGTSGPIGDWSLRDIASTGDIEAFLLQYVRPVYRGGRYSVSIFDANGREIDAGVIPIPDPPATPAGPYGGGGGGDAVTMKLIDKLDGMERRMMQPATPPPDPLEQFRRVRAQMEEMKKDGLGGDAAMMMAMMQSQSRQPAGPDPYMIEQMATMRAELAALKSAPAALPPPPPMPAPENPMMTALAALLPTLATALVTKLVEKPAPDPNAMSVKELLPLLLQKPGEKSELAVMRESLTFFKEMQGETKTDSLQDKLRELAALKELATDITGGGGGNQGTTFWDALGALFSNKAFGDNLGTMLGQEVKARQTAAARVQTGAPKNALPADAGRAPAPPAQGAPPPSPERIAIPDDIRDYCARMEGANDDVGRIQAVVEALNRLRGLPQWSPFVNELLGATGANDKEKVLKGLKGFLGLLAANKVLDRDAGLRVLRSFDEQWDAFHATFARMLGGNAAAPAPAAAPSPTIVTPPPEPAPAPGGEEESDDEDEDEENEAEA